MAGIRVDGVQCTRCTLYGNVYLYMVSGINKKPIRFGAEALVKT